MAISSKPDSYASGPLLSHRREVRHPCAARSHTIFTGLLHAQADSLNEAQNQCIGVIVLDVMAPMRLWSDHQRDIGHRQKLRVVAFCRRAGGQACLLAELGRQQAAVTAHDGSLAAVSFARRIEGSVRQDEAPIALLRFAYGFNLGAITRRTAPRVIHRLPVLGNRDLGQIADIFVTRSQARTFLNHTPPRTHVLGWRPTFVAGQCVDRTRNAICALNILGMLTHVSARCMYGSS